MRMVLMEGIGSSYIDSICVLVLVVFVACRLRVALIFALFFVKMMSITVSKAAMLTIKAVARELMDAMNTVLMLRMCVFIPM